MWCTTSSFTLWNKVSLWCELYYCSGKTGYDVGLFSQIFKIYLLVVISVLLESHVLSWSAVKDTQLSTDKPEAIWSPSNKCWRVDQCSFKNKEPVAFFMSHFCLYHSFCFAPNCRLPGPTTRVSTASSDFPPRGLVSSSGNRRSQAFSDKTKASSQLNKGRTAAVTVKTKAPKTIFQSSLCGMLVFHVYSTQN